MIDPSRREFLSRSMTLGAAALTAGPLGAAVASAAEKPDAKMKPNSKMKLGLVTYLWGKDWDLPTLIANCEKSGVLGVEPRTTHPHGVEPSLDAAGRKEVKKRFDDSPVVHVGPGSNERFDYPDAAALNQAIETTKAFVKLSHDTGGSGVKVKPNSFQKGVEREKTIEQIGRSLNVLGKFAGDYGQEIRLEVHGSCGPLPVIKQIMDVADNPNVGVCWNCNGDELEGKGLAYHFNLVKDRFGATAHVRELNVGKYPYQDLIKLYVEMNYTGWILLECRSAPKDRVAALVEQREVFERMVAKARG
ncbi:MAG: TIM barrel protein [Candidatus Nealsonbacteria bacterium]|nr:TIM barrel protein [Candidatus Nealsonbacteria bacterium]